jgi:hypothetical protein
MKHTNQSLLVYSIVMFFLTTAILMLIILKDNRAMYVEEAYVLSIVVFTGYMTSFLSFMAWKHS